jgi:hypothetical protein
VPSELPSDLELFLYKKGTEVRGQVTLNLCGAHYPSERLRTARVQTAVASRPTDTGKNELASFEAVLYRDDQAAASAMSELAAAAKHCPQSTRVPSGVEGLPPMAWRFHRAPDAHWPKVKGVQRLAYDVTLSASHGRTGHLHYVYQRSGRTLVALYGTPSNLAKVTGTKILGGEQGIAYLIAIRLANTPPPPT